MNNRVQQRFDRSIQEAVEHCERIRDAKPTRDVTPPKATKRAKKPKGRLYLDPLTGATVWEPAK
jgi:hypothetical protein